MTDLIACLSTGKGTWAHVSRLIEEQEWDNIFLITNEFGKENFQPKKKAEFILINSNRFLSELVEDIKNQLKEKVNPTDVAVNLISGTGKEHMAIISALLKLGLGIRLITLTPNGIKEI
ncbi:hypothetical protein KY343_01255 [Candidatus Woesearchaeota archaeon]|nr:hypothetical protein [Candidatus Woesearchaeota archaeon]